MCVCLSGVHGGGTKTMLEQIPPQPGCSVIILVSNLRGKYLHLYAPLSSANAAVTLRPYSTGHLFITRNGKACPGWISYLRMGAFYTNFSLRLQNALFSWKYQPSFLIGRFLIRCPVL